MHKKQYSSHLVNLQKAEEAIIRRCADQKGLGPKGFSAALRLIIHEWDDYQKLVEFADREYWTGSGRYSEHYNGK